MYPSYESLNKLAIITIPGYFNTRRWNPYPLETTNT